MKPGLFSTAYQNVRSLLLAGDSTPTVGDVNLAREVPLFPEHRGFPYSGRQVALRKKTAGAFGKSKWRWSFWGADITSRERLAVRDDRLLQTALREVSIAKAIFPKIVGLHSRADRKAIRLRRFAMAEWRKWSPERQIRTLSSRTRKLLHV